MNAPNGKSRFDLHLHTNASDGVPSARQVVERAARLGIGVAVTDHSDIRGSLAALSLDRCPVIPAIEINSRERLDTLAYFRTPDQLERFYLDCVEPNRGPDPWALFALPVAEVLRSACAYGAVCVAAHPFAAPWRRWSRALSGHEEELLGFLAGIEGVNGGVPDIANRAAIAWSREANKPITGGSDAHALGAVGSVVTCFPKDADPLDALTAGEMFVVGRRVPFAHWSWGAVRATFKHARWWPAVIARGRAWRRQAARREA